MVDLALNHPKIGIVQATVPRSFSMMQKELEESKAMTPYLTWNEYAALGENIGIKIILHILRIFFSCC